MEFTSIDKIVSQIINTVGGGRQSDDSELDERLVRKFVTDAASLFIRNEILANKGQGERAISGQYIATFKNIDVSLDADLNLYYSTIPVSYMVLPNDMGVFQISEMKNQFTPFNLIRSGDISIYSGKASLLEGNRIHCWNEKNTIYYVDNMADKGITKVLMKLIVSDASNINSDAVFIPAEMSLSIIERVMPLLGLQMRTPNDQTNDQNKS